MVTVTQRPIGLKIIDQAVPAAITDSSGDALVTFTAHSLFTGSYVYISSDLDEYNGFWYVTVISPNTFKISPNAASAFVEYYQDVDIDYYQTSSHLWSSIFLPIVYKATNDRWPINTVDAPANVTSHEDDNGYTRLNVDLDPGVVEFMYLNVTGYGVFQVVDWGPGWVTITMVYNETDFFTTVQKYYNNYQVRVNIYAGLPADHPWEEKKPYALVGELSLTPNNEGEVMFSVADYLKSKVAIRNNPTLFSMPLNLDAFTGFYIATAESYDTSDTYSVYTSLSDFEDDTLQFYAIAGQLPFKNVYGGMYSDYVYTSGNPAAWLTTLSRLIGVVGKYFDISFIKNIAGDFQLLIGKYANDYLYETETIDYTDQGVGVYRMPIEFSSQYDQFCVQVQKPAVPGEEGFSIPLVTLLNSCPGSTWIPGVPPDVTLASGDSGYIVRSFSSVSGASYTFSYNLNVGGAGLGVLNTIRIALLDDDCNVLGFGSDSLVGTGAKTGTVTVVPSGNGTRMGVMIRYISGGGSRTFTLNGLSFEGTPGLPAVTITEEICIDIYEECTTESGDVVLTSRRLLEDSGYRLTEGDDYRALET